MKKFMSIGLALLLLASSVYAGTVSRGLDRQMQGMLGTDQITVLVVLEDQADLANMELDLRATSATLADRHAAVVGALQNVAKGGQANLLRDLETAKAGGEVLGFTPHWLVNSVVVRTTVDGARALALRPDVAVVEANLEVELIGPVKAPQSKSLGDKAIGITPGVVSVGARRVWDELGIRGENVIVGVLDTGVDGTHPALSARWQGNFAPTSESWLDAAGLGDATPVDQHYHGTHVMGTITGLATNDTIGVAPGAHWIATNVINMSSGAAFDNAVITSLEFMTDPDGDPLTTDDVPDVVQNSWGVNESFSGYVDCDSRWWTAIDNCEAAGVVLTWSAGNEGSGSTTMRSPADRAASPYNTFSVGSTNNTPPFAVSSFSSRGPSGCGGAYAMKPEIVAPGESIYSAEPGGTYQYLDGTSMAGPHLAGVVALMRSANPNIDVMTIKQILMDTAIPLGAADEDNNYGHGFVDAYAAVLAVMQGYGTVEGFVTEAGSGDPVAGATVVVQGTPRSTSTDAAGFYRLMLEQGPYTLDVSAFGYLDGSTGVTVVENDTVFGDVVLTPAPSALLSGHVYDDASNPVDGATVTVLATPLTPATTDVAGYYELSVPTGTTYDVLAQAYGMGSQQVSVDFQAATVQDFTLPALIFDDFESGNLTLFPWETSGTAPWFVTTDYAFSGTHSVRSGGIAASQSSVLSITVEVIAASNVEFYRKVSSESGYDYLRFAIDGVQQAEWAGELDWTLVSYPVTTGSHTLTWSYEKDGSVDSGLDAAWVDFVVFPTIGEPVYPSMTVSPLVLTQSLAPGATAQQTVTIDNVGDGQLDWTAVAAMDLPGTSVLSARYDDLVLGKDEPDPRRGDSPLLGAGGPDGFGYLWADSDQFGGPVYGWVEINGIGTAVTLGDDAISADIAMGMTFPFYGTDFTSVKVCSNGFLSFTTTSSPYTNATIPTASEPNNLLAAFWDDLDPTAGGTVYTYADAVNSRFIVEYDGVQHYDINDVGDPQTFQVILDADGTITFQYKTMTGVAESTVGIENAGGTDGLQVVYNAAYLHDALALQFSFTPPPDPWLTVAPAGGTLPGQTGGGEFIVTFDATLLAEGVYTGSVVVGSNDPDHVQVVVPVTLTVSTGTAVDENGLPRTFALGQAVPNPFNPQTSIAYAVPAEGGRVTLRIFDLQGRLVRTLVDGNQSAGEHLAVWTGRDEDGRRAASGTYFYRLEAPGFTQTEKMVLVK
jgi:subtilisin family serine protease